MAWKKTMQVFHTSGVPPSNGRIILPIIGWTRNSKGALGNSVSGQARSMTRGGNGAGTAAGGRGGGDELALQHQADLLVRMRVFRDDGVRFQIDVREHHLVGGTGLDVHAGKDRVAAQLRGGGEKEAHATSTNETAACGSAHAKPQA